MEDVEIVVRLGAGRSYPILIRQGGFEGLARVLERAGRARSYGVVTDRRIEGLYGGEVRRILDRLGVPYLFLRVPMGEAAKDLVWASRLYDRLLGAGFERGSALVALGGGSIGDLTGFVAATYLRGIPYVQVPTTLLAQVDSSVGGKTGVNHRLGKNLIGAFHQPRGVCVDLSTLGSLPERDFRSGFAEVVKYGAIGDPGLFRFLEDDTAREALFRRDRRALSRVVERSCRTKAKVVERDEREESGHRAVLNFGHTFGHAVEKATGFGRYRHGEAVAIGMSLAAAVSRQMGFCGERTARRVGRLVESFGLPSRLPSGMGPADLVETMERDKKAAGGTIRFVVLRGIGRVGFERMTARELARAAQGA